MLKLAWITDIHNPSATVLGRDMNAEEQADYKKTVLDGAKAFAARYRADPADLLVNTGDDVDTTPDPEEDKKLHAELAEIIWPEIKLKGNHDVRHQGLAEQFNFLNKTKIIDSPEATMIFWDANARPLMTTRRHWGLPKFQASAENIAQLEGALKQCNPRRPVLLFNHISINEDSFINPLDEGEIYHPWRSCYTNQRQIVKILKMSGLRIFNFSGHRHYNYILPWQDTNITFFGLDRLTRWEAMGPQRPKGWSDARILVNRHSLKYMRNGVMQFECEFRL